MARSFTKLYFHAIFAVKYRNGLINPSWESKLFSVMGDTLKELGHAPIIINGTEDHVHLLWRHDRTKTLPEALRFVKGRSSHWINDNDFTDTLFRWQGGYGAFSVSVDRVPAVKNYIARQKIHHQCTSMIGEYESLLKCHGEHETTEYLFSPPE